MPEILHMPKPSLGHRTIHKSSNVSCRHVVVYDGRLLFTESSLESHAANAFMASPYVKAIREQFPAVTFIETTGETSSHVFDLYVEMANGVKLAIAVKPFALAEAKQFRSKLQQIAQYVPSHLADAVVLVTDRALTEAQRKLNRAVVGACRDYTSAAKAAKAADEAVLARASNLKGTATLDEFVAGLPSLEGQGFRAALRALKKGHLEVESAHLEIGRTRVRRPQ